jgi:hypothetical protein
VECMPGGDRESHLAIHANTRHIDGCVYPRYSPYNLMMKNFLKRSCSAPACHPTNSFCPSNINAAHFLYRKCRTRGSCVLMAQ